MVRGAGAPITMADAPQRIAFVAMDFQRPGDDEFGLAGNGRGFPFQMSGGYAHTDLYHTIVGLQQMGHEVHLFAITRSAMWRRSPFEPERLPFPATSVPLDEPPDAVPPLRARVREAVDSWQPGIVFAGFLGYHKPHVLEALARYPLINRQYFHEALCILTPYRYKEFQICPNDVLRTPNVCRACALRWWGPQIRAAEPALYAKELLDVGALKPTYHRLHTSTLAQCRSTVVYNEGIQRELEAYCSDMHVIPMGVDLNEFIQTPLAEKSKGKRTIIFMPSMAGDPHNGVHVLAKAGHVLAQHRADFEIRVIAPEDHVRQPWFTAYDQQDRASVLRLYEEADIVAAPPVWGDPMGYAAIEGMAAGRPIVASRAGVFPELVGEEETGLLFTLESSDELRRCLERLMDNPALRARMGDQARRAAANHDWDHIIKTHYPPLLERAVS